MVSSLFRALAVSSAKQRSIPLPVGWVTTDLIWML
jgi:hypothetical protein